MSSKQHDEAAQIARLSDDAKERLFATVNWAMTRCLNRSDATAIAGNGSLTQRSKRLARFCLTEVPEFSLVYTALVPRKTFFTAARFVTMKASCVLVERR
jgi:hypothetical protein